MYRPATMPTAHHTGEGTWACAKDIAFEVNLILPVGLDVGEHINL